MIYYQNLQVAYLVLGHSSSLVRVAVVDKARKSDNNKYVHDENNGYIFLRCPSNGRLDDLINHYNNNKRPSIAHSYKYSESTTSLSKSVMGNDWVIFSCHNNIVSDKEKLEIDGIIPTLESFPILAKKMRDALMSYIEDPIPEIISGHNSGGSPSKKPHLVITPLANVGWKHSDGALLGIALILPRNSKYGTEERKQLRQAVTQFLNSGGILKI